ncbi:MAG: ilvB operon leader peptide IvbL, partial [Escherichia coli]
SAAVVVVRVVVVVGNAP